MNWAPSQFLIRWDLSQYGVSRNSLLGGGGLGACWPQTYVLLDHTRTFESIALEYKRVHERKRESSGHLIHHKRRILEIVVLFKGDGRLGSVDDGVTVTRKRLVEEKLELSTGGVMVWILTAAGNYKGNCDIGDVLDAPSAECQHCRGVLHTIQGLIRHERLPIHSNWLDIFKLAKYEMRDGLVLME